MLEWVQAHSKTPRSPWEIEAWSALSWAVKDVPYIDIFAGERKVVSFNYYTCVFRNAAIPGPAFTNDAREDVKTWFEFGELDDYVSFGGKA